MKTRGMRRVAVVALAFGCLAVQTSRAEATKCEMKFSLSGWSAFYKTASGRGTITCDNGQSVPVSLVTKGGGLTIGKSTVMNGKGTFSDVAGIDELFGTYAAAEAHAGMGRSSDAQVVTKGIVSLALTGTGEGVDLGFSFGKFVIKARK